MFVNVNACTLVKPVFLSVIVDNCEPNPCENDGTCEAKGNDGYKCSCVPPYAGKHCEICMTSIWIGNDINV